LVLIILVVVVLVVTASLVYNRRVWRPRQAAAQVPGDGLKVAELTAPLATLAILLLVFVLVQTYASWSAVGRAETDEATATLLLFREADLVAEPALRDKLHKQVVCYATSVIHQDWPAMGDDRVSNVPTYWGALIRSEAIPLARTRRESIAGKQLIDRDAERTTARQERLGEARPTVPDALSWLMLAAVVMVLGVLGTATFSSVQPAVHLAIVLAAAAAFAFTLILIQDLDQPYAGALTRDPTQTEFVRDQIAAELRGPLPCNSSGLPTGVPGFRATTAPLG
jgi:hypothetical protein